MTMQPQQNQRLTGEAAGWVVRLSSPTCTVSERAAFERWLAASDAHAQAFIAAQRLSARLDQAVRDDPRWRAMAAEATAQSARGATPARPWRESAGTACRRAWLTAGRRGMTIAASLAVCALGVTLMSRHWHVPTVMARSSTAFSNTERHPRSITLDDGSIVHLDTGSEVEVSYAVARRTLRLRRGRAYFEVAHDATRPFTVEAGGTSTVALGTHFEVQTERAGVNVTLAEGSVAVTPTGRTDNGWREVLQPGERLQVVGNGAARTRARLDTRHALAWTEGRLEFDGTPLREAVEAFNRYADVKVSLGDPGLGDVPIGGSFTAGSDTESFVKALAMALPLHYVRAGAGEIVLFSGQHGD